MHSGISQECLLVHPTQREHWIRSLHGGPPEHLWNAYAPVAPVVYMDEKPLLGETREPLPAHPGDTQKVDFEYVRNGTWSIFVFVELLGSSRHVSVREHRTATDWAEEIKRLVEVGFPVRDRIILVTDNTGNQLHFQAWELSGRCWDRAECNDVPRRGEDIGLPWQKLTAWESDRNEHVACIRWYFTTNNARTKLVSLYPKLDTVDGAWFSQI